MVQLSLDSRTKRACERSRTSYGASPARRSTRHPDRFPDPGQLIAELHGQGSKAVTILDPGIKVGRDYWVYAEGLEQDVFCK